MDKKYLLLISITSILATLLFLGLASPTSAEHATCTESDEKTCGSLVDWGYVFGNTEFNTINFDSVSSVNVSNQNNYVGSSGQEESLAFGTLYGYRSLYGGIWSMRNQSVFNRTTGVGNYDKDNLWVPSYNKSSIRDKNATISPPNYPSTTYITYKTDSSLGINNNSSAGFYELKPGETNGFISYPKYKEILNSPVASTVARDFSKNWNLSVWGNIPQSLQQSGVCYDNCSRYSVVGASSVNYKYNHKLKVNTVTLNASVPEYTNITVNIYDSNITNSEKLGFVKFDSDYTTSDGEVSRRIRHKNSTGEVKMGLKRFETVNNSVSQSGQIDDFGTYRIDVKLNRKNTSVETPKLFSSTNITLSRSQTAIRGTSPTFDGYPRQRLLLNYDTKRGERIDLTNKYTLSETLYSGLTNEMSKNLDSYLSSGDRYNESKFPQIPREELKGNESHRFKENDTRFYSAGINATANPNKCSNNKPNSTIDYHAIDCRNTNITGDLTNFFSKVYASINSIEPSVLYQQNSSDKKYGYKNIRSKDWERVVDSDGIKMYMSFDAKADKGIRKLNNSNFNFFDPRRNLTLPGVQKPPSVQKQEVDHEARNDTMSNRISLNRTYSDPKEMINKTPNVNFSQNNYSKTLTRGTRLSYTLENITIDYDYGSYYEINNSLRKPNITNRSIKFGQRTDSKRFSISPPGSQQKQIYSRSPEATKRYFNSDNSIKYRKDPGFATTATISDIANSDRRLRNASYPPKVTNINISKNKSQFNGLFAEVIDVSVSYDIDYHQLEVATQPCPDISGNVNTNYRDQNPSAADVSKPVITNNFSADWQFDNYREWIDAGAPKGNPVAQSNKTWENNNPQYITNRSDANLADGRPACQDPNHEAIDGISSWDKTPTYSPRDKYTKISNNNSSYVKNVTYNATDPIVEGNLDKLTNTTEVRLNASLSDELQNNTGFTPHEMTNQSNFSVRTAYSDTGSSKHWFTRNVSSSNPYSSLWTRAEATSAIVRDSISFNQSGEKKKVSLDIPRYPSGLSSNAFSDAQDATSTIPVDIPITLDDTDEDNVTIGDVNITLDLYNYGPSDQGELVNVTLGDSSNDSINASNVDVKGTLQLSPVNNNNGTQNAVSGYTHTNVINVLDDVDITDEVERYINNSTSDNKTNQIPININYAGSSMTGNSSKFDIDQRFDVVLKFDTKTGLLDISSRWDYATFRDTRYDILYNSTSPNDYRSSYKDAAIPYLNFSSGEREFPNRLIQSTNMNQSDFKYPSESMFVRSYLIPTSGSILSENRDVIRSISKPVREKTESNISGSVFTSQIEFGGLDSNLCSYDSSIDERYCSIENFKFANNELEEEVYDSENITLNEALVNTGNLSDYVTYPTDDSGTPATTKFESFREWTLNLSSDTVSSWDIAGKASWETDRISNQSDNQLFDRTRIEVRPVENITRELNESEIREYRNSPVQHEFDQSTIEVSNYTVSPAPYEDKSVNDSYVSQQYVLELKDKNRNPISLRRRFEEIEGKSITNSTQSWGGQYGFDNISIPTSEYMEESLQPSSYSNDSNRKIQEGICIDGEELSPFGYTSNGVPKAGTNSAGTRVDTKVLTTPTQLGVAIPGYPTATEHCYLTDYNGKLYFTIIAPDSQFAENSDEANGTSIRGIDYDIEFTGSEDFWWEYPPTSNNTNNSENIRLLESSDEVFPGTKIDDKQENLRENSINILGLILLILAIMFVLARILKIRLDPSSGPSTLELLDVFSDPLSTGLGRLLTYVAYLLVILIGASIFTVSLGGDFQVVSEIIGSVINLLIDSVGVFVDLIVP